MVTIFTIIGIGLLVIALLIIRSTNKQIKRLGKRFIAIQDTDITDCTISQYFGRADGKPVRAWAAVGLVEVDGEMEFKCIKKFYYNPEDEDEVIYARNCAEELVEKLNEKALIGY